MKSASIIHWTLRYACKRPLLWILFGTSFFVLPLCRALSPFKHLGQDPTWGLASQWSIVFCMLSISLTLVFLSRQEDFLVLLAKSTRWKGEWGTLLAAAGLSQLPLAACALLLAWDEAGGLNWLVTSLATCAIVCSGAFLALRLRVSAGIRVLYLWIFLWGLPGLLS